MYFCFQFFEHWFRKGNRTPMLPGLRSPNVPSRDTCWLSLPALSVEGDWASLFHEVWCMSGMNGYGTLPRDTGKDLIGYAFFRLQEQGWSSIRASYDTFKQFTYTKNILVNHTLNSLGQYIINSWIFKHTYIHIYTCYIYIYQFIHIFHSTISLKKSLPLFLIVYHFIWASTRVLRRSNGISNGHLWANPNKCRIFTNLPSFTWRYAERVMYPGNSISQINIPSGHPHEPYRIWPCWISRRHWYTLGATTPVPWSQYWKSIKRTNQKSTNNFGLPIAGFLTHILLIIFFKPSSISHQKSASKCPKILSPDLLNLECKRAVPLFGPARVVGTCRGIFKHHACVHLESKSSRKSNIGFVGNYKASWYCIANTRVRGLIEWVLDFLSEGQYVDPLVSVSYNLECELNVSISSAQIQS